jgi:hypothetical protein
VPADNAGSVDLLEDAEQAAAGPVTRTSWGLSRSRPRSASSPGNAVEIANLDGEDPDGTLCRSTLDDLTLPVSRAVCGSLALLVSVFLWPRFRGSN